MAEQRKKAAPKKKAAKKSDVEFTAQSGKKTDPEKTLENIKDATNKVQFGANSVDLDLAGFTINEVQEALADSLSLNNAAEAYIDGQKVADKNSVKLGVGQKLEFMKEAGVKGFDSKELC